MSVTYFYSTALRTPKLFLTHPLVFIISVSKVWPIRKGGLFSFNFLLYLRFEKSHFNPLYKIPIDELEGSNEKSKRKTKLEKFYTKKDAIDDGDGDGDGRNYSEMSNMTHDQSVIGVFQNPLYGIPNKMYAKDETNM